MGREKDADCRLCRREGHKLFLKGQKCNSDKCALGNHNILNPFYDYDKDRTKPSNDR